MGCKETRESILEFFQTLLRQRCRAQREECICTDGALRRSAVYGSPPSLHPQLAQHTGAQRSALLHSVIFIVRRDLLNRVHGHNCVIAAAVSPAGPSSTAPVGHEFRVCELSLLGVQSPMYAICTVAVVPHSRLCPLLRHSVCDIDIALISF